MIPIVLIIFTVILLLYLIIYTKSYQFINRIWIYLSSNPRTTIFLFGFLFYLLFLVGSYKRYSDHVEYIQDNCSSSNCANRLASKLKIDNGFHNSIFYLVKPYN